MGMHELIGTSSARAQEVQGLLYAAGYKVDNAKGYVTRAFVETLMRFQRDSAIPATGEADDLTMEALHFASICEPAEYEIVLRGKRYLLSKSDYQIVQRRICAQFRKGTFHDMRWRVIEARTTFDTLKELKSEQYVVGWLIDSYTGATFPKESPLKAAEGELAKVEAALKSQDVKKLHAAIPPAEAQINKALAEIRAYRKSVIEGGGAWVSALEFTRTAAFTSLGIMAGPAVATLGMGAVATGFVAGAGTAAVEAIAFEVGKGLAGTSQGAGTATVNVLRDSFIGGTVGAITRGKYAEKVVKGVSGKVAARLSSGWARGVARSTVAKFTGRVLQNSTSNVLEGAMTDVLGQFKAKETLSAEELEELRDGGEVSTEDLLAAQMRSRASDAGITYVAFTATPKAKTLELFGRRSRPDLPAGPENLPEPFHLYSMRQAIEEGFILDVLQNYTPYSLAFRLAQQGKEMASEEVERDAAMRGLMSWVKLHPYNIAQKVQVVVEHFRANVAHLLGGSREALEHEEVRRGLKDILLGPGQLWERLRGGIEGTGPTTG